MADIKQAARWMQGGLEVKRASWGNSPVRLHTCNAWDSNAWDKVHDDLDRVAHFTAVELLAEDWEIADV